MNREINGDVRMMFLLCIRKTEGYLIFSVKK